MSPTLHLQLRTPRCASTSGRAPEERHAGCTGRHSMHHAELVVRLSPLSAAPASGAQVDAMAGAADSAESTATRSDRHQATLDRWRAQKWYRSCADGDRARRRVRRSRPGDARRVSARGSMDAYGPPTACRTCVCGAAVR